MAETEKGEPHLVLSDEEDDDDDDGWEECINEEEGVRSSCTCLYCDMEFSTPDATFTHCSQEHGFDMKRLHYEFHMDCFSYIKLINYIRKMNPQPGILLQRQASGKPLWDSDEYMKPTLEDDGLLHFDIEELSTDREEEDQSRATNTVNGAETMLLSADNQQVLQRLEEVEQRAKMAEEQLQRTLQDFDKVRAVTKDLMINQTTVLPPSDQSIQHLQDDEDEAYFSSYGHFSIHKEMLQDNVRTGSYRDAICNNVELFEDKVVLDVGCGTGILSMFAAKAGAKLVLGVDMSDIIYQTMDIIRENGLEDKIKIFKGRMEDVTLPVDKVDIIISEWMGYFLLFESMLDTVLWARDKYLTEGGILLPDKCDISLAALDDEEMYRWNCGYWDDVYGFKMTCMRTCVMSEAKVAVVNKKCLISEPCIIKELDVCTCQTKDLEFSNPFKLHIHRNGRVTAIVAYFDIDFSRGKNKVNFSTGPTHAETHWKQTVFMLDKPRNVTKGDLVEGKLTCKKNRSDPRSLIVTVSIGEWSRTYQM